ncbi:DUF4983 domain-containing protein [Sphingobacterium shayense]|uniref:alkaline phosphatase family protein n=1 Tax=Sphingobacterium shayense TaxID=626343 RepID=UPI0015570F44|nr:alkaline phosphatase family protein [Sphingobacterium shayense]NQD69438.1 DUF4983 domain-containing protein [Sphingobacterium shayense]
MSKKNNINPIKLLVLSLVALSIFNGCNEEFNKMIPTTEDNEEEVDITYGQPKVLLLIVDGARGQSVRDAKTPILTQLLPNSIHSWTSLSEEAAQGIAANWTNILTGVDPGKHGVIDNNFSNNKLDLYPSIFSRISNFNSDSKLELISADPQFLDNYNKDVQTKLAAGDEDVKDKVITALQADDCTMITAHFRDVQQAGLASGYDLSYDLYSDAINDFDAQVGDILESLKQRKNINQEKWLVIITSSQGGDFDIPDAENDNTIFSEPALNTFTIMYSPNYSSKFIGKPYIGNKFSGEFMRFNDTKYAELQTAENELFNLGNEDFTIEIKVKKNRGSNNNYRFSHPSVIGKRETWQGGWDREMMYGWVIHLSDNFWVFNGRGDTGYGEVKADEHQRLNDATWNTITVVGLQREGQRYVRLYTNGEFNREGNITGWGNMNSDWPLRIGFLPTRESWRSDAYLADVKIWKIAMPEDMVQQYSCEVGVDPNHPYFDYLAGYWPMMGANSEGMVFDEGPFGANLKLGDAGYPTTLLNDYICTPSTDELGQLVPRTFDVPAQIISWLKVPRQMNWQLDGRVWLDK